MIQTALLAFLYCPATHQKLRQADESSIDICKEKISVEELRNIRGEVLMQTFESGLIREDGRILYPIFENVAQLLIGDGIQLPTPAKPA